MDEQKINKVSKAMAVNIKREKKKHMLTMSHAKHLHDSPYGAAFSVVFWLLNPLFERMV